MVPESRRGTNRRSAETETLGRGAYRILEEMGRLKPAPATDGSIAWSRTTRHFLRILEATEVLPAFSFWLVNEAKQLLSRLNVGEPFLQRLLDYSAENLDYRYLTAEPRSTIWNPLYELGCLPVPPLLAKGLADRGKQTRPAQACAISLWRCSDRPWSSPSQEARSQARAELLLLSASVIAASAGNQAGVDWIGSDRWSCDRMAAESAVAGEVWLACYLPQSRLP